MSTCRQAPRTARALSGRRHGPRRHRQCHGGGELVRAVALPLEPFPVATDEVRSPSSRGSRPTLASGPSTRESSWSTAARWMASTTSSRALPVSISISRASTVSRQGAWREPRPLGAGQVLGGGRVRQGRRRTSRSRALTLTSSEVVEDSSPLSAGAAMATFSPSSSLGPDRRAASCRSGRGMEPRGYTVG